jgi:translation initiation factor 5
MPDIVGEAIDQLITIEAKNRGMPHNVLKTQPKKGKKDKSTKKADRKARKEAEARGEKDDEDGTTNGNSPGESGSDGGNDDGDVDVDGGSDDELTRRINAEAKELAESEQKEHEW